MDNRLRMTRADFNDIILQLSRKLYGTAYRILYNQQEAEDAVQEIFIKLWNMKDSLIQYNSIEALSTTMIKNYSIDQLRKRKSIDHEHISRADQNVEFSPSPQEQMEKTESQNILNEIIRQLPLLHREMIRFRDIDGLSYEEISVKTNQNINNIRVILSRARKSVRAEYNKYLHEK